MEKHGNSGSCLVDQQINLRAGRYSLIKNSYLCFNNQIVQEMNTVLLLAMPSGMEWIIIVLAILLLFGGKKIPELMRGIGKGIREFNDAKNNVSREIREGVNDEPKKTEDK